MTRQYFQGNIPRHIKEKGETVGRIAIYPEGYCGTMSYPPDPNLTNVILYDEDKGICIAWTSDPNITKPAELGFVKLLTEAEALGIVVKADKSHPMIFKEEKINARWEERSRPIVDPLLVKLTQEAK